MLNSIKKHVLKLMYEYHYHMGNHYGCVSDKGIKHISKEFKAVEKLVQL